MKLDDLKYLPILTECIFYKKNQLRQVQEIAEIKIIPVCNSEEVFSDNRLAYVLGLLRPGFDFCEITGRVRRNKNWEDHTLIWCSDTIEFSNGYILPLETRNNLICAGLSEILEYNSLKKLKTK